MEHVAEPIDEETREGRNEAVQNVEREGPAEDDEHGEGVY